MAIFIRKTLNLAMRSKARRYLLLLLISVAMRIFFYFFQFEDTALEQVAKAHILYDVIFSAIVISLLETRLANPRTPPTQIRRLSRIMAIFA